MRYNFAKVYDFPEYQVLVTKEFDAETEESEYQVMMEFRFADGSLSLMRVGFRHESDRDKYFDIYNKRDAKEFLENNLQLAK